ncbi:MAG: iron chaperone [Saccharofermentanales bacterium]
MSKSTGEFSDFEKAAMKQRAKELKAETKTSNKREQGEAAVQEVIAAMPESDRDIAERIHRIVTEAAPELWPKTWYGMPAYANADGKVICFFQGAVKFEARYASFGFNDAALLDDGNMWPTAFALTKLTAAEEKQIKELVKKAARQIGSLVP